MYDFKNHWKKSTVTFKRHIKLKRGTIDMAPLIDVVFLLLIFFMLTSSYIFQPGIKINLPRAVTSEVIQEKNLVITIGAEGLIYLNQHLISLKQLNANPNNKYNSLFFSLNIYLYNI